MPRQILMSPLSFFFSTGILGPETLVAAIYHWEYMRSLKLKLSLNMDLQTGWSNVVSELTKLYFLTCVPGTTG